MNESDNGMFEYNLNYPPLCVKPHPHEMNDFKSSMNTAVTSYLQDSYRDGLKHEDTILASGLSSGEAGVLYFRELNHKRMKCEKSLVDVNRYLDVIAKSLEKHLGVDVCRFKSVFDKHINVKLFQTKQFFRKVNPAIKLFLKEIDMKTKGYTSKLKSVMHDVRNLESECEFIETKDSGIATK